MSKMSKKYVKPPNKGIVSIEFPNEKVAEHFVNWLDGSGEQDYWQWMEAQEDAASEPITAVSFKYTFKPNENGIFLCEGRIES